MNKPSLSAFPNIGPFQFGILVLSLVVLGALAVDTLYVLPPPVHNVIQTADLIACLILLIDFFVRLFKAESRREFLKWGWIDLLASIPTVDVLRWGRLLRVLRLIRLLRGMRSFHRIVQLCFQNRLQAGSVSLGLMAFLLVVFSSLSILLCERSEGANIKTGEDALWWSITTMTTVGYGDRYPTTTEGRLVGTVLMICGVGMFAALSGMVASLFLGSQPQRNDLQKELLTRIKELQIQVERLGGSESAEVHAADRAHPLLRRSSP